MDWDQAGHTIIAFNFADFFKHPIGNFLSISDYYPPFVHLLVAFFMLIFGKHPVFGPLVVTGFFVLAIIFLYLYVLELFKNRLTALLAAFLFAFLPNIYALSRQFLLEIPLVAMVLGSLFFLEKSDHLRNGKNTVLFSIFLGLALAIKWTAVFLIIIPIFFKLIKILPGLPWKNMILSAGVILTINLPWYLENLPIILNATQFTAQPNPANPQQVISFESFKFYAFSIANFQLTWLGMTVFLIAAIYYLAKRRDYLLPMWIFIYLVFTFIGNKDLRYVVFLASLQTIIIAYFLSHFQRQFWARNLTVLLLCYYAFYYFPLSFGWPFSPVKVDYRYSIELSSFGWIDIVNLGKDTSGYLAAAYNSAVWPNAVIARELLGHNPAKNIRVLIICEKPFFNQVNMELARKELKTNKERFFAPYEMSPFGSVQDLNKYLSSFDVILLAKNNLGYEGGVRYYPILKQISDYLKEDNTTNFLKINNYHLPDGDVLYVYKPVKDPV